MYKTYKGTFNYYGEIITIYTSASNIDHAFTLLINKLSKKVDRLRISVYNYFKGKNNYTIKEEVKRDVSKK